MSNILIIGNGFDIYHGLPTRYTDFLFLARNWDYFLEVYNNSTAVGGKDKLIEVRLGNGCLTRETLIDFAQHKEVFDKNNIEYLNNHITNNTWIKYFLDTELIGYGWVDFEAEIDKVLNDIESFFSTLPNYVGTNIIA